MQKEEIIEDLIKKGYRNKLIDYQEFLELYNPYEKEMSEKEFARVIGISYGNHNNMKNSGTRARVLKKENKITEKRKEEIREDLIKRDYTNKLIYYQEFLELYKPHEKEMSEIEFAEILGISYGNYSSIRNKRQRAKILKKQNKITDERKEKIREDLIKKGYTNKSIDYQEFLELYKPYEKGMSEIEFAEILGIYYSNYMKIRNEERRAKILKEENKIPGERKEEIIEDLREKGYRNKLIYYQEFLELYKPYQKGMSEVDFAKILGISYVNYMSMKKRETKAKVLKEENKIQEKRKEEIREDLIKRGYTKKLIDYQEFLELYNPYEKEMSEVEFAEILGIFYSNYEHMKNGGTRARVLKEENKIPDERKGEIREDLIKRGYAKKSIDYQEFLELYKPYKKEMSEVEFAEILGISYSNYMNIRHKGTRARVLKEENRIPEKRKEEIQESEKNAGNIVEDMKICYEKKMKDSDAIAYVRDKYGISRKELLKILEQELNKKREIIKNSKGKVYPGEENER